MSALRDGWDAEGVVKFEASPNDTVNTYSGDIDTSGTIMERNIVYGTYFDKTRVRAPLWRRLWFLVSCIPRYLITGSVEVP